MIQTSTSYTSAMTAPVVSQTIRMELLTVQEDTIDQIDSYVEDGAISVDGDRDVMRQFSTTLDNWDNSLTWSVGGKYWIDKRIKLWVGLKTPSGIEYAPQGVFLLETPGANSRTQQASFAGGDKMKLFDGNPRGKLSLNLVTPKGRPIGAAIRTVAEEGGETKFAFDACEATVPYDLTYKIGTPRLKVMKELAELAVYRLFYDVDGFLRFTPKLQEFSQIATSWRYDQSRFTLYGGGDRTLESSEFANKIIVIGGSSQTTTIYVVVENNDPNDPLSTVNIGEWIFVHNDGSPDPLINTEALAYARANYELRKRIRNMKEHINFTADPNFLHEAHDVIEVIDTKNGANGRYELLRFNISFKADSQMTGESVSVL